MRIRNLVQWAAFCALMACIFLTLGTANSSFGGMIQTADYRFDWTEEFGPVPANPAYTFGDGQAIAGNVLDLSHKLLFSSYADPSDPWDFLDGKMVLDIKDLSGQGIKGLKLAENGAYRFFGSVGNDPALASVSLGDPTLRITSVNNVPTSYFALTPLTGVTTFTGPSSSSSNSITFTQGVDPSSGAWSGNLTIDLSAALANSPYQGQKVTGVELIFDNQLMTHAGASSTAYIDKKDLAIAVTPAGTVPEPSSIVLLGMGVLALVFARKRKDR